jgi:hypothetical protein
MVWVARLITYLLRFTFTGMKLELILACLTLPALRGEKRQA